MDDPAENASSVLEWEPRIDVVGGDAAKRVAPELESGGMPLNMGGGAAEEGGDSDDDSSVAATHAFKGMPAEGLAMRKQMAIGELTPQKREEGVPSWGVDATTHFCGPPLFLKNDGFWYALGTKERGARSKAKKAWYNYRKVVRSGKGPVLVPVLVRYNYRKGPVLVRPIGGSARQDCKGGRPRAWRSAM